VRTPSTASSTSSPRTPPGRAAGWPMPASVRSTAGSACATAEISALPPASVFTVSACGRARWCGRTARAPMIRGTTCRADSARTGLRAPTPSPCRATSIAGPGSAARRFFRAGPSAAGTSRGPGPANSRTVPT
jgi:hypothetical protein